MSIHVSPEWELLHTYNRLVRRGLTKPLAHSCGNEFVQRLGDNDEPVLACYYCDTITRPGAKIFDDLRAVVKEHFND